MQFVKSKEWLEAQLGNDNVRIVDCRFSLGDPTYGVNAFTEAHLPGAVYFGLDTDLSGPVQDHGGRHPLPDSSIFKRKLEKAGIARDTTVVTYDDGEGAFASRFWWILKYVGHTNVYVLDGGFQEWTEARMPVTNERKIYKEKKFDMNINESMLASYEEVKARSRDRKAIIIDSRARSRYLGIEEPIDSRPGHIPSAINHVWEDGFEKGRWKDKQTQKERFEDLCESDEIIVYCGSGVTAIPNILALMEAGFNHVKLYAGSYSDWVSYPENQVEKEES